jgi:hypothetical protein
MGSRTVRLDDEAEEALLEIRRATGMTISQALKKGLVTLRGSIAKERKPTPWEIYERLDIGPGGYGTTPPSRRIKRAVWEAIRKKHRR